jgi:hypothetical protein
MKMGRVHFLIKKNALLPVHRNAHLPGDCS